jgi:tripartite-type tricarboxylate transporter receptor subunit TctC
MPSIPRRAALVAAAFLAAPRVLRAQRAWPDGPIRLVAPFPPGGSADLLCRLLQNPLQQSLGVPIVVENRPGASGALGTASVARAAPDGQSFVLVFDTHVVNPALNPTLGFEAKDLRAVMLVATAPMLVATANAKPFQSMGEVIARARSKPESVSYGTIGIGSLAHLTMERLQDATGCRMIHVPYRGGGPMSAAASSGEVDLAVASVVGLGGQVGTTLRALAQTGEARSPLRPQIPTLIESGVAGVSAKAFWGLLAPAGVPTPLIQRFHDALAQALAQPAVRQPLEAQGVDVIGSTPAAFESFLTQQAAIWTGVVRDKNISVN